MRIAVVQLGYDDDEPFGARVDRVAALVAGQLAGAFIDVFGVEPLPAEHPFWAHPALRLTPHVASLSDPVQSAATVIDNIGRAMRGEPLRHAIDRSTGY